MPTLEESVATVRLCTRYREHCVQMRVDRDCHAERPPSPQCHGILFNLVSSKNLHNFILSCNCTYALPQTFILTPAHKHSLNGSRCTFTRRQ